MQNAEEIIIKDIISNAQNIKNKRIFNNIKYEWLTDNRILIIVNEKEKIIHLSCNQMVEITLQKQ